MKLTEKILKIVTNPNIALKHIWRKVPIGSFELRSRFDAFDKPSYAYGIYRAAKLARALGIPKISVIEFGVSKGNGLLAMEKISKKVEKITRIKINVVGFDTGIGLTPPLDYRDMPYEWKVGEFKMDINHLKNKLKRARLVLGDVSQTIKKEMNNFMEAPIGFVSFDLDFYSSTKSAFKIFDGQDVMMLPRVYSYFDDVYSSESDCSDFTGELLAIREFNNEHLHAKISKCRGLTQSWNLRSSWTEGMYILHNFNHSLYNKNVHLDS